MQSEIPDDVMATAKSVVDRMPTHAFKGDCIADVASAIMAHAALSTGVEPVAWRWRSTLFTEWNLSDKPPIDQRAMEIETETNMEGLEWQALYTQAQDVAGWNGELTDELIEDACCNWFYEEGDTQSNFIFMDEWMKEKLRKDMRRVFEKAFPAAPAKQEG